MSDFYFTVGQRYRHELHPLGLRMVAENETRARMMMHYICGERWARCYAADEFDMNWFPNGECLVVHDTLGPEIKLPVSKEERESWLVRDDGGGK